MILKMSYVILTLANVLFYVLRLCVCSLENPQLTDPSMLSSRLRSLPVMLSTRYFMPVPLSRSISTLFISWLYGIRRKLTHAVKPRMRVRIDMLALLTHRLHPMFVSMLNGNKHYILKCNKLYMYVYAASKL